MPVNMPTKIMLSQSKLVASIILVLVPLAGISIDLFTPSMPSMVHFFHTLPSQIKLTIGIYLLGYGVGQMLVGPASDMVGRKKILLPCLLLFVVTSLMIPIIHTIYGLLVLRLLQGLFVSGAGLLSKTMLGDCYQGKQLSKMSTNVVICFTLSPVIAPYFGGYLQHYLSWKASFFFMGFYGIICLLLVGFYLPETHLSPSKLSIKTLFHHYRRILTHPIFLLAVLMLLMTASIYYIFNTFAPFFLQVTLHYSTVTYGQLALLFGLFVFAGPLCNRLLLQKFKQGQIALVIVFILLFASISLIVLACLYPPNVYAFVLPLLVILFCQGFMGPYGFIVCLSQFPDVIGIASALMAGTFVLGGGIIASFGSWLPSHSQQAFGWVLTAVCVVIVLCVCALKKGYQEASS